VVLKPIILEKHDFAVALWRLQTLERAESSALRKIRTLTSFPKPECLEFGVMPKHRSRQRIHQKSIDIREVSRIICEVELLSCTFAEQQYENKTQRPVF
jgi:hypothetical protein